MFRSVALATSALALIVTPAIASAASPAQQLSLSPAVRTGTPSAKTSKLAQPGLIIAGILAVGVAIGAGILIADSDDDPDSN